MWINESSARYGNFAYQATYLKLMLFLWCFLVAAGLLVTEQVQSVPERERDLNALGKLHQERILSRQEPPLTAACSFDEEIYISVEPCRENKYHPHQLPSEEKLPTPRVSPAAEQLAWHPRACGLRRRGQSLEKMCSLHRSTGGTWRRMVMCKPGSNRTQSYPAPAPLDLCKLSRSRGFVFLSRYW